VESNIQEKVSQMLKANNVILIQGITPKTKKEEHNRPSRGKHKRIVVGKGWLGEGGGQGHREDEGGRKGDPEQREDREAKENGQKRKRDFITQHDT
jgi:hypothetical protein